MCTATPPPSPTFGPAPPFWTQGATLTLPTPRGHPQEPHPHLAPAPLGLLGGVPGLGLPLQPPASSPQRPCTFYCTQAIVLSPPSPLPLFCKWPLPHHFAYTLQPLSSGDSPGSDCGFCACAPPPATLPSLKGALIPGLCPLVSCHHITA